MSDAHNKTLTTIKNASGKLPDHHFDDDRLVIDSNLDLHSLESVDKDFLSNTTINGGLNLYSLKSADKDFLKNTTINSGLYLRSLKSVDKDFLKNTTINGNLYLSSLETADKDFLKNTTINGGLNLSSLKAADKDFLSNTTINGYLYLRSLETADKETLRNNVSQLSEGYNEKLSYCFFDGILSKVLKVSEKNGYTIYHTPFEYVVRKDNLAAHSKTVKQGIIDINYKEYVENVKHEKLSEDDEVSVDLYRAITGACFGGIESWLGSNDFDYKLVDGKPELSQKLKVKDVLTILRDTNAYGLERFEELVK